MRKTKRRVRKKPQFYSTNEVVKSLNCSCSLALAWANLNRLCIVGRSYIWTEEHIQAFSEELER